MNIKTIGRRILSMMAAVMITLSLVAVALPTNVMAAENKSVTDASKGVFQVNLNYKDDLGKSVKISSGSGFLINQETIVTCAHVIELNDDTVGELANLFGKSKKDFLKKLYCSVTIARDVECEANVKGNMKSDEVDFAVLTLSTPIQNRTPLTLRDSSTVALTEDVYAIGFPEESALVQDINTYTTDDVTITHGNVNKVATGANLHSYMNADYFQTSVKLTAGNSGGPMVDEQGYVVGICEGATGWAQDDYFYAITINQVRSVLDAYGTEYSLAGESTAAVEPVDEQDEEPVEEPAEVVDKTALANLINEVDALNAEEYSEDSYAKVTDALNNAVSVNSSADASQAQVDDAVASLQSAREGLEAAPKSNKMIIIIAAVVAAIIIIVIIILVISSGNKKKAPAKTQPQGGFVPPQPSVAPVAPQPGFNPTPMSPVADSNETTVLSSAGETTVLQREVNGGVIINKKSNERVVINREEFTVGRERTSVSYCITGNTSVGRVHAKFVVRGGQTYLVDNSAKNGTFINGSKCRPNQENLLKSGDTIAFSDEEFTFQA